MIKQSRYFKEVEREKHLAALELQHITRIARVAHEVNRAYCQAIGEFSQPVWEEAPQWQQDSAINGVKFALANPDATPAMMHESWLAQKIAEGWIYGPTKDPEHKYHPCMMPYDQLPQAQRVKDHLFRAVVSSLR